MEQTKILVVEDEVSMAHTIGHVLREAGHEPIIANTAEDGLRLAYEFRPDIALLDVMVPTMGGWQLCQNLRMLSADMPIIFLTALGDTDNVVKGLEMGADDYLVKPFKGRELLARVNAQLRRALREVKPTEIIVVAGGEIMVDLRTRLVKVEGREVELTPREFDLFSTLAKNAGRVVPSVELARKAWGIDDDDALTNLKPYIHYLRKKIESDPASPRWILTARGVGYRLASE